MNDFVHLHLHTEYSLLDGACRIDRLFERAKELGQDAVAITDHGVMYGALAFYRAAKNAGVKPIIGCEVYVAPGKRSAKETPSDRGYFHLILLCKNKTGYQNLIRLVSLSFTEGFYQKPRIDLDLLEQYHEGLIALSGCLKGQLPQLLLAGDRDGALLHAGKMRSVFGKDYYIELQDHGLREEALLRSSLVSVAGELDIPLVATNDVHYLKKEDAESHDVLLCIQTRTVLSDPDRMRFDSDEYYLKSGDEMAALFPDLPEAVANTRCIADQCEMEFDLTSAHLPHFKGAGALSSKEYLEKKCREGLEKRLSEYRIRDRKPYEARLSYELSVVEKMGFCDYFLIVADFVNYAKDHGIFVGPGRGSGAGSLAAWCLNITELDPIAYHLIFERFLNPERVSMPDFDIDFCFERRYEVIDYLVEQYGTDNVCQIVTFNTMAARAALRDVGRVMGLSYAEVDRIAKRIPRVINITLKDALKEDAELRALCSSGQMKQLMDTALFLEGMPRNASIHAAGIVLTDEPVDTYVPLAVNNGAKVTQFTMNEIADLGLLKIDLLGLRYLTVIRDSVRLIRRKLKDFDIARIPLDDPGSYRMIADGKTSGMFQIESSGMRNLMMQIKPENIEEIAAAIALYRPGPMQSIPKYLENKRSGKISYLHPDLQPILESTHGCIVYQEQVMQILRSLAGYSFGRADTVRKAMSKKKPDVIAREREIFLDGLKDETGKILVEGAVPRGVRRDIAESIYDEMRHFGEYAFNRSHAVSYAILCYRTAFLKCKFPREFMAALLTNQMGSDKYGFYFAECQASGIPVLPPSAEKSEFDFSVEEGGVRFGLTGVKNLGKGLAEAVLAERRKSAFTGYLDFVTRLKPHGLTRKALESLIAVGALDFLGHTRSSLMAGIEDVLDRASHSDRLRQSGQLSLFDLSGSARNEPEEIPLPRIAEFSQKQLLRLEKENAGVYFSGHPLSAYPQSASPDFLPLSSLEDPERFSDPEKVRLFCMITSLSVKSTKSGQKMAFLRVEDLTGSAEILLFPKTLEKYRSLLNPDEILVVEGTASAKDDEVKVTASALFLPENAKETGFSPSFQQKIPGKTINFEGISKIYLRFSEKESTMKDEVLKLLSDHPGPVPVVFYDPAEKKQYRLQGSGVAPDPELISSLENFLGNENVVIRELS